MRSLDYRGFLVFQNAEIIDTFQVTNIDGVLENHNDFLDRCLKDCMLTNPELLKVIDTSKYSVFSN